MSSRVKIAAGNWKMHGSFTNNETLLSAIHSQAGDVPGEVMVFAPAIYLDRLVQYVQDNDANIIIGAQNLSEFEQGAYTGEVSAAMLADVGCTHVLVGHSERRSLYHESDDVVAKKAAAALAEGLMPVVCCGETLEERQADETMAVVLRQLDAVANEIGYTELCRAIIAYEPVWAIGTGQTATPEQAQDVHEQIRAHLAKHNMELASQTRILYGGSVNGDNASELFSMADIDGGLVGGASLKAESFVAICHATG